MAQGDWSPGDRKVQCIAGQIVKGVSVDPRTGAPRALLCCFVSAM